MDGIANQGPIEKRQGAYLPHWSREGAIYSVTFRLADSLPQEVLNKWLWERDDLIRTAERSGEPLNEADIKRLEQLCSDKVEAYLDAGHGNCWMRQPQIADIIVSTLLHFHRERYYLLVWCVMPNHVHALLKPGEGMQLPDIVHSWKSFSANAANKTLRRTGQFWQKEYYDHLIRDEIDLGRCQEYILTNPERAGMRTWRWMGSNR